MNFKMLAITVAASASISFSQSVKVTKDDFTGATEYRVGVYYSPVLLYGSSDKDEIYLSLHSYSWSLYYGDGVKILFDDGSVLEYPKAKVDVTATQNSFSYSAYIEIDPKLKEKLLNNKIKKYKLYIFDNELTNRQAIKIKDGFKNLIEVKKGEE